MYFHILKKKQRCTTGLDCCCYFPVYKRIRYFFNLKSLECLYIHYAKTKRLTNLRRSEWREFPTWKATTVLYLNFGFSRFLWKLGLFISYGIAFQLWVFHLCQNVCKIVVLLATCVTVEYSTSYLKWFLWKRKHVVILTHCKSSRRK